MQRQGPATLEGATNHPNHCSKPSLYFTQWIALILFQSTKYKWGRKKRKRSLLKRLCTRNRTNADPEEWVWAFEKMNMQRVSPRGRVQEGTDSEKEEAWHEIGGGIISDSELLDSMDGGRALQLKHEINVESTIIQRGTTKRDRDQPLEEFQPLLPLGRVSLLSELAGCEDQLINTNLESGWLIAASLSWRLSGRGGACYRNLFPGVNLVRSILLEKKDGNEWEDWSSLFISRKELVSTSLIRRTNKKRLTVRILPLPLVVDFREEKRGIRQRRKANRAKLLWPFREVQLYRMLVREVGELLRSIDSPSISNPNENRSE
ncbi:hypothetical protein QVD17_42349 [Tagetes erecta]|uniref:Uncharacterized protein n=1 Tax=Tagetes erecta TaxID=13708 RepID=A0AAD8NFE4_TARER|nr:hypothetical protein QVD17_42349 [Tagetes erecta]